MRIETHRAMSWERKLSERQNFFYKIYQYTLSLQATQLSFFPKKHVKNLFAVRALPCVFQKGSLTAEAAMVLPLFLLAMLTIFGCIPIYARQIETTQKLLETAEKTAIYAAIGDGDTAYDGTMTKVYRYAPEVKLPGIGALWLTAQVKVRPWTGYDGDLGDDRKNGEEQIVYISQNKEAYHTSPECSYLEIHLTSMSAAQITSARNSEGDRYKACDKCCHSKNSKTYYVSENGKHYHTSLSCSGLSRSPEAVLYKDVENLPLCIRCTKRES